MRKPKRRSLKHCLDHGQSSGRDKLLSLLNPAEMRRASLRGVHQGPCLFARSVQQPSQVRAQFLVQVSRDHGRRNSEGRRRRKTWTNSSMKLSCPSETLVDHGGHDVPSFASPQAASVRPCQRVVFALRLFSEMPHLEVIQHAVRGASRGGIKRSLVQLQASLSDTCWIPKAIPKPCIGPMESSVFKHSKSSVPCRLRIWEQGITFL